MKHVIIGTAGHIDHGKTTLIRALTGRNTDRLKEEQLRGITIELGFTWFDLKDGTRCGIIDVPGHEKFVGNMVAGVAGMDLVMMVVAADEGIMPQTREHLDILELLGVEKTILVINKCDLVDEEWLEMVREEFAEELKGTILENAPVACVSAATGQGIPELKELIAHMVRDEVEERDAAGIPRLPIDRVFTLPGHGTIVTGTLLSGSITKEDTLIAYPKGLECRIRSIQVHEKDQEKCLAGQRVALNLSNIKKEEIRRGDVLASKNSMKVTERIDAKVRMLPDTKRTLTNRERLHFYTGTSEVLARAVILDKEEIEPGGEGLVQFLLEEPLVTRRGDRFVIRFYSPMETIGGGIVLEPTPQKKKRFNQDAIEELTRKESGSITDVAELHIKAAGRSLLTAAELARNTSFSAEEIAPAIEELKGENLIRVIPMKKDTYYWHMDSVLATSQEILRDLIAFHGKYPYRLGIGKAEIHSKYMKAVKMNVFDECLRILQEEGAVAVTGEFVTAPDFEVRQDETYRAIEAHLTGVLEKAGCEIPRFDEIGCAGYPENVVRDVLQHLIVRGVISRVGDDIYAMTHYMDDVEAKIRAHFEKESLITFVQIKEMFGTSRKSAKFLAEYMDARKVTKKVGAETERVPYR